ncbi:MAG TPA: GNAT family N-acetyltransferase [Mucilaginibacter sp.]|jgi:phosphinothricin acetyltransferase|nr:GNAT family N-acetyltransferase [Mucilaginibacter sp.]
MEIAQLTEKHWPEVSEIYASGLATGTANFSQQVPAWIEWNEAHLKTCRLVITDGGKVLGWAALTAVSDRCVYAGVAEVSVYVHEGARGKGIGSQLVAALVAESEKNNLWTLEARIFAENLASIRIHQANGFRIVGRRERIGQMNGVWCDVVLLERRSTKVGV